jgi:hypothetical protein
MKRAILSFYDSAMDTHVVEYQQKVLQKFNQSADYHPLFSKTTEKEILHYQGLDHGVSTLFDEGYDTILILDTDCVPLNTYALEYIFSQAEKDILIGNAQRSMHIENDEHMYIGSSCLCLSKNLYEKFGRRTFAPDHIKADTCEYYSYDAEAHGVPIEIFMPKSYIRDDLGGKWNLGKGRGSYGIGTTFINSLGVEMFFHLFSSRQRVYNTYFYDKCEEILNTSIGLSKV